MKIFNSIDAFKTSKITVATIGTFDGVHLGHQKIIQRIIRNARDMNCESLILTFFPHPKMVLDSTTEIKLLNTIDERSELLQKTGLDNVIIHPFDKTFSTLSPEEFVKNILIKKLKIKKIIIGHDHRFGSNRTANIDDLIVYGKKYDFEVEQISAKEIDDVSISSTKIRSALEQGNIDLANEYLGYHYFLSGTVITGKQLGTKLGFPTANVQISEGYKLIPKKGVYIVKSRINSKIVFGMMNIGTNPTVGGHSLSIEVHYLDFDRDLYQQEIKISMLHYIRAEQKFASVNLLIQQLERDKNTAYDYIQSIS